MEYDKIKDRFGKWAKYWKPFIEDSRIDKIFRVLQERKGKVNTAPLSSDVFRAFETCDPDNLKVILVGICPYHTFVDKKPVADGLMMSSKYTGKLQPSLWQVYNAWEKDYSGDMDPEMWHNADLEYLSKQGVLLYNVALTVQEGNALSDNLLWSEFNKFFWEEIIGKFFRGICIVFMGNEAHKSAAYINPEQHYHWCISHPASAAYNNSNWSNQGVFKKIDKILSDNNGYQNNIQWYLKKNMKEETELPPWVTGEEKVNEDDIEGTGLPWCKDSKKK